MAILDDLLEKDAEAVRYENGDMVVVAYDWVHALGENERYEVTVWRDKKIIYEGKSADLTTLGTHASLCGFSAVNVNTDDWQSTEQ